MRNPIRDFLEGAEILHEQAKVDREHAKDILGGVWKDFVVKKDQYRYSWQRVDDNGEPKGFEMECVNSIGYIADFICGYPAEGTELVQDENGYDYWLYDDNNGVKYFIRYVSDK